MGWLRRNRRYLLIAAVLTLAVTLFFLLVVPDWFWHPLGYCPGTLAQIRGCKGYNFHSGAGANFQEVTLLVGVAVFWLKHNCYEHGCPWLGRVKGNDGHMRCKGHHKKTHPEYGQLRVDGSSGVN